MSVYTENGIVLIKKKGEFEMKTAMDIIDLVSKAVFLAVLSLFALGMVKHLREGETAEAPAENTEKKAA